MTQPFTSVKCANLFWWWVTSWKSLIFQISWSLDWPWTLLEAPHWLHYKNIIWLFELTYRSINCLTKINFTADIPYYWLCWYCLSKLIWSDTHLRPLNLVFNFLDLSWGIHFELIIVSCTNRLTGCSLNLEGNFTGFSSLLNVYTSTAPHIWNNFWFYVVLHIHLCNIPFSLSREFLN